MSFRQSLWVACCLCFGIYMSSPMVMPLREIGVRCYWACLGVCMCWAMPHVEKFIGRIRLDPPH